MGATSSGGAAEVVAGGRCGGPALLFAAASRWTKQRHRARQLLPAVAQRVEARPKPELLAVQTAGHNRNPPTRPTARPSRRIHSLSQSTLTHRRRILWYCNAT